jgi:hypothetical protein
MTETWLYPDGQVYVTAATMFENRAGHQGIAKGYIEITTSGQKINKDLSIKDMNVPNQYVMVRTPGRDTPGLSIYWKSGKMDHNTYIYRSSFGLTGAPSFFRWPDYHRQAYTQRTIPDYINPAGEKAAWPPGRGAFLDQLVPMDDKIHLRWRVEPEANATASFNAFFRLAMVNDPSDAQALVEAELDLLELKVEGGVIHGGQQGYNDQEGCYEIRKTGAEATTITLPPDKQARSIRIKVIGLTGHGAVTARLDGQELIPQLSSDGGIADDPLAPIHDQPEAPANAALLTVQLTEKNQILEIREEEGIQLVYQSRDPRRNYMIFSTKMGPDYSGMQFSLLDGHARHLRGYGQREWALTENLLQWFAYMGYSPEQMLDQLRDFEVIKNGPDEIIFKYVSNNANDGAQSTFEVTFAAEAPAMQMNVRASFTVLDQWPYKSVQFFDVFPFKGVEPKDWWYDQALFMDSQGKWRTFANVNQTFEGEQDKHSAGPTFQGLFSAERGNMLMLTRSFTPKLPTHYVICSNYIDLHSNVMFDGLIEQPNTIGKGQQIGIEYELAIWGDETLTRDQIIEIGKTSIDAGKLVLPQN